MFTFLFFLLQTLRASVYTIEGNREIEEWAERQASLLIKEESDDIETIIKYVKDKILYVETFSIEPTTRMLKLQEFLQNSSSKLNRIESNNIIKKFFSGPTTLIELSQVGSKILEKEKDTDKEKRRNSNGEIVKNITKPKKDENFFINGLNSDSTVDIENKNEIKNYDDNDINNDSDSDDDEMYDDADADYDEADEATRENCHGQVHHNENENQNAIEVGNQNEEENKINYEEKTSPHLYISEFESISIPQLLPPLSNCSSPRDIEKDKDNNTPNKKPSPRSRLPPSMPLIAARESNLY